MGDLTLMINEKCYIHSDNERITFFLKLNQLNMLLRSIGKSVRKMALLTGFIIWFSIASHVFTREKYIIRMLYIVMEYGVLII